MIAWSSISVGVGEGGGADGSLGSDSTNVLPTRGTQRRISWVRDSCLVG